MILIQSWSPDQTLQLPDTPDHPREGSETQHQLGVLEPHESSPR